MAETTKQANVKTDERPKRLIHFLEDGFTAFGQVWYRGQEVEVEEGSQEWDATVDRRGTSWLDMTEEDQTRRYGRIYFRNGPWPGLPSDDPNYLEAELTRKRRAPFVGRDT